jgi:hypothetical protein
MPPGHFSQVTAQWALRACEIGRAKAPRWPAATRPIVQSLWNSSWQQWLEAEGWGAGGQPSIGVASMCDYSLHNVRSRPARVGDKLISTSFPNSGTRGFAAVDDPNVAVCLLPGTELAFEENLQCVGAYGFGFKKLSHKMARFRQVDKEQRHVHHDALELPDGEIVKLTKLRPDQHATVLQMPASPREITPETEPEQMVVA